MATYNEHESGINSMSEEIFNSLKDSNGKIPSLANQLVMTDDENSENYYKAGNGISIDNGVISSNIPSFYTSFDFTSVQSVTGSSSQTAAKTLKTYTVNLPKGKYVSLINGVIKTTAYTVDLYPQIDGVYAGAAGTNSTTYVGCSGIATFNLTDGDHTIDIILSSRGTASLPSYTRTTLLLIRVGD